MKQPYATARAHDVNFGDKTARPRRPEKASRRNQRSVEAQAFTCYVTARVEPAAALAFPVVLARMGQRRRVDRRTRVPRLPPPARSRRR